MSDPIESAAEPESEAETGAPPPRTKQFRKKFGVATLAPDALERQGRISTKAFLALGRDAALSFLNTPDEALGGRPLNIATQSVEGERAVLQAIEAAAKQPR